MKKLIFFLALVTSHTSVGQFRLLNDPYVNTELDGLTVGVFNDHFSYGSNVNIGQWNGIGATPTKDITSFSELDRELLRIQFKIKNIKLGYHAHLHSYQTIRLDKNLFNMLYGDNVVTESYNYTYYGNSTFTHSLSAQKYINERTRLSGFLNLHNLNSFYNLEVDGVNSFSEASPQIVLNSNYTSINTPHLDNNRNLFSIPNDITRHDSVHITKVLSSPSSISISFALTSKPTDFSKIHIYVNNLGPTSAPAMNKEFKKLVLSQEPSTIDREALLSSSPIVINTLDIEDSTFVHGEERIPVKARPRSIGGSFEVEFSPINAIGLGLSTIQYADFNQSNILLYSNWKLFEGGKLTAGIQIQNVSTKTLSNALLGLSFNPTKEIRVVAQTSTGLNYAFYNSELIPRSISRLNYTITALITIP